MRSLRKIFLLSTLIALLGAVEGHTVGSSCYQVNNTPCSPNGSTRTCTLVPGSKPLNCLCLSGRWDCPVEP
jgi:hypothetical protein